MLFYKQESQNYYLKDEFCEEIPCQVRIGIAEQSNEEVHWLNLGVLRQFRHDKQWCSESGSSMTYMP